MSKYIRAVVAAEAIEEKYGIPLGDLVDTFVDIPAADVVEVVRCRECVHWKPKETKLETHFQTWNISAVVNLQNIAAVKAIFAAMGSGKKVLTDAIFLPNKEAEDKGNRLSGWNCQSNPQEQCPVIPAGL